jgi:hypothetical protein
MAADANQILAILDRCCDSYTFPMLDNGYVYLAASRLSLYRSVADWAMAIEVFGFSPRAGLPDTSIYTFASKLYNRDPPEQYTSREAYNNYLTHNPHNKFRSIFPVEEGPWLNEEDGEFVADGAAEIVVRGRTLLLPPPDEYKLHGVDLADASHVRVFELCRFLADVARELVLATVQERRISVPPDMTQVLQLEEWHHPNVADAAERPSGSATFRQLVEVLANGDVAAYQPSKPPNTHWRNWPNGGSL